MSEGTTRNGLQGDGDEGHLAKLLLAGRMRRRRKVAGLALARKILDDDEDVEDEDGEDGGENEHGTSSPGFASGFGG